MHAELSSASAAEVQFAREEHAAAAAQLTAAQTELSAERVLLEARYHGCAHEGPW